jgi:hypothetical protein
MTPWYETDLRSQLEKLRRREQENQLSSVEYSSDEEEDQHVLVECMTVSSKQHLTSISPDGQITVWYRPDYYKQTMNNINALNRKIDKIIRQVERTHFS